MANAEKRWLTAPNSRLTNVDLATALRKEDAWDSLSAEQKNRLYSLLPEFDEQDLAHDADRRVKHPLKTPLKRHIETELRKWQTDLANGRESKKWRADAIQAGRERAEGKWNSVQEAQRELAWGKEVQEIRQNTSLDDGAIIAVANAEAQ